MESLSQALDQATETLDDETKRKIILNILEQMSQGVTFKIDESTEITLFPNANEWKFGIHSEDGKIARTHKEGSVSYEIGNGNTLNLKTSTHSYGYLKDRKIIIISVPKRNVTNLSINDINNSTKFSLNGDKFEQIIDPQVNSVNQLHEDILAVSEKAFDFRESFYLGPTKSFDIKDRVEISTSSGIFIGIIHVIAPDYITIEIEKGYGAGTQETFKAGDINGATLVNKNLERYGNKMPKLVVEG